jgi:hypothetical protein
LKGSVKYIVKAFKVSEGKDITDEIDQEEHDDYKERDAYLKKVYFAALTNV